MLRRAAANVRDPRATFVLAGESGDFEGGDFDGVLASLVLEHTEDPRPVLARAARASRQGAWLRIFDIHPKLQARGKQAHFVHDGEEVLLPSYAHDAAELARAMGDAWRIISATDWYADATAHPKLARYIGEPVMLDVVAVRTTAP